MSIAKLYLAALVTKGDVADLLRQGPIEHLLRAHEVPLFAFVRAFIKEHHKLPEAATIALHTGEELPEATEPPSYYLELLRLRYVEIELKRAMQQAAGLLQGDTKDPQGALQIMTDTIMELVGRRHQRQIVDFRQAYELVVGDYVAQWTSDDDHGINFGWPTLDKMTGGLVRGDMVSFVGRPQAGKTMLMLYAAYTPWRAGKKVLLVSMEMKPLAIHQRLTALHAAIPMSAIKTAELTTKSLHKMKDALTEIQGFEAPFWVVDGNFTATVEDVWGIARHLQPDAIFVDGAYLLKHPKERDRYKRVAENADLIKHQLSDLAPVICSWQFSREAAKKAKKKTGEKQVGLEDIGYTDAIGQVSSLVLGLFEEESPMTLQQRRIEILKGRNGEVGHFLIRWDWKKMSFDEVVDEPIESLKFGFGE